MSHVTKFLGIPCAALGPARTDERVHGNDEYVRIADVMDLAKIYTVFIASLA